MATVVRIERRKRGIFGWLFLILFWGFNLLMGISILAGISDSGTAMQGLASDAERAGYAAGTAIGVSFLVILWAAGSLILGLFVLLTRGSKVITEQVQP